MALGGGPWTADFMVEREGDSSGAGTGQGQGVGSEG